MSPNFKQLWSEFLFFYSTLLYLAPGSVSKLRRQLCPLGAADCPEVKKAHWLVSVKQKRCCQFTFLLLDICAPDQTLTQTTFVCLR